MFTRVQSSLHYALCISQMSVFSQIWKQLQVLTRLSCVSVSCRAENLKRSEPEWSTFVPAIQMGEKAPKIMWLSWDCAGCVWQSCTITLTTGTQHFNSATFAPLRPQQWLALLNLYSNRLIKFQLSRSIWLLVELLSVSMGFLSSLHSPRSICWVQLCIP